MPTPAERKTTAVRAKLLEGSRTPREEGFTVPQVQSKWFDMFGSKDNDYTKESSAFPKANGIFDNRQNRKTSKGVQTICKQAKREKNAIRHIRHSRVEYEN